MTEKIRPSAIAGSWYPGNPTELRDLIRAFFDCVPGPAITETILGLISPHAGYVYSGQTAAFGYKQLLEKSYETVVILSPMHQTPTAMYNVADVDFYNTPLGNIPVAHDLVEVLLKPFDWAKVRNDREHSLEIQLPFLQVALGEFKLVPIMVGHGDVWGVGEIVRQLTRVFENQKILFVASSDLHHIANYDEVVKADRRVIEALSSFDLNAIRKVLDRRDSTVCGRVPISILCALMQELRAESFRVLDFRNSGDVTGERNPGQYTVGYLSGVFIK